MKSIFITVIASGFIAGCSVFGSFSGSANSSTGSTGSSGGSSATSSGGSSSAGFFNRREKETVLEQPAIIVDKRVLIAIVDQVTVDRFSGGAIIKARGTVDGVGYSDIDLVADNKGLPDENGVVTYKFKGKSPIGTTKGPTERSNQVYAGASITALRLPTVKRIRVVAAQNEITVSK
ncbi:MAG: hypothetical protein IME92_00640 [Proteobacteria bacterium]|nr:hypothetical protein [Pseudomonadota bacterium]